MNILYIAPDIPVPHTGEFVGGSTHVLKIAESLAKKGCKIFIISRRMKGQKKFDRISERILTQRFYRGLLFPISRPSKVKAGETGKAQKIFFEFFERTYFLFYHIIIAFYIIYLLSRYDFGLVLERNSAKGVGVIAARIFNVKTVVEVIDVDYSKLQLRLANKILAYTKRIIPGEFHNKVMLTHAGVDMRIFKPMDTSADEIRRKFELEGKKVVVYVGELSDWHGADILIDLAEKLKDVKFLVVGKSLESLREEAKKRDVAQNFVFTGFVKHEEVPKYISAADVAVAPYKRTSKMNEFYFSPIKIFEYMACGTAIVASDLEIIRDIIKDARCGLLAKPEDTEDFAEEIKSLFEDEALRKKLGENGKEAVGRYSWDEVAEKILG